MKTDSDILHLFVAVAMMVPILVFYVVIAMEVFSYHQPVERSYTFTSLAALTKACSAFATDK